METMKRRTKAEKRKKMAGIQKARDMMMAIVVVVESDVDKREEGKTRGEPNTRQGAFYYATIRAQCRSN